MTEDADNAIRTLCDVLVGSGLKLWDSQLIGNQPPATRERYQKMRNPRPGDWVFEWTAYDADVVTRVGRLVLDRQEPVWTKEAWAEAGGGDEPIATERAFYVELVDGRLFRWTNAGILRLFTLSSYRNRSGIYSKKQVREFWASEAQERHKEALANWLATTTGGNKKAPPESTDGA